MQTYPLPLVPGPVSVPPEVRAAYAVDYGSADMEEEFFALYAECEAGLRKVVETENQIAILSGEGMLALWSALKSVVRPGERVLAVSSGVFGNGFGVMAAAIGAEVEIVECGYDSAPDPDAVRDAARRFRPKLVTAIHCETPSGTLLPMDEIGRICREVDALFCVDYVASAAGAPVLNDAWQIDLGLLGSQKALSLMPDLSMVAVSERAWAAVEETRYAGYDALLPWRTAAANRYLPYTHNWHALAGLGVALEQLFAEGLPNVYRRHEETAALCRRRLAELGVALYPVSEAICSPTVTAARVPDGWTWAELDAALRREGVVAGGSYGPLANVVFRFGHMGSQARPELIERATDALGAVLAAR